MSIIRDFVELVRNLTANLNLKVDKSSVTSGNTPSTVVSRDAGGNFSAGTITAALNGTAANANKLINMNWSWSGQGGQPNWLWGGTDGANMYVYNPANFSVNYAVSASKIKMDAVGSTCAELFSNTPANYSSMKEVINVADAPNTGWWFIKSIRHSAAGGPWGTQIAYGWEGNANVIYQRNISAGTWSTWRAISFVTGMIMIWSGSAASIPVGWALCNGGNGTPNLQDRFVVGAGSAYGVGGTGGRTDAIVPIHYHTGGTDTSGAHAHNYSVTNWSSTATDWQMGVDLPNSESTTTTSTNGDHSHTFSTNYTGEATAYQNLPPFYALCYIMKI